MVLYISYMLEVLYIIHVTSVMYNHILFEVMLLKTDLWGTLQLNSEENEVSITPLIN